MDEELLRSECLARNNGDPGARLAGKLVKKVTEFFHKKDDEEDSPDSNDRTVVESQVSVQSQSDSSSVEIEVTDTEPAVARVEAPSECGSSSSPRRRRRSEAAAAMERAAAAVKEKVHAKFHRHS